MKHNETDFNNEDRDDLITQVEEELRATFKRFSLPLDVESYLSSINVEKNTELLSSVIMIPKPVFDLAEVQRKLPKIKEKIVDDLVVLIMKDIDKTNVSDKMLTGSSYAIAERLTLKCFRTFFRNAERYFEYTIEDICGYENESLNLRLSEVVDKVAEKYEEKYKKYMLWDEGAISAFLRYLLKGDDSLEFPVGAMSYTFYDEKSDIEYYSKEEFFDIIEDAFSDYPTNDDLYEIPFQGYNFYDYLPVDKLDTKTQDAIYQEYLLWCE